MFINSHNAVYDMTFCSTCGKEAMPTDKFCHSCGATLAAPTSNQNFTKEITPAPPTTPTDTTVKKPNPLIGHSIGYKDARNAKYVAIITGFLGLCGIAQIYIGQKTKGFGTHLPHLQNDP